jgi:hypothetical protein
MVKMNELIKSASFAEKVVRCGYKKLKEIKVPLQKVYMRTEGE